MGIYIKSLQLFLVPGILLILLVFFSIPVLWEHICILNVRLGGETYQQNVIMHKAYLISEFSELNIRGP